MICYSNVDYRFLIFTFATPSLIVTIFCFAIGSSPKDLSIGIINNEVRYDCENFSGLTSCEPIELSCLFLNNLEADRKCKLVTEKPSN